jgi:hypothetical protein
MKKDVAGESAE